MRFSDRLVRCEACGVEFVYTVREQRKRAEKGQPTDPPSFCKGCRSADVRLAEAAGQEEPEAPAAPVAVETSEAEVAAPDTQTSAPADAAPDKAPDKAPDAASDKPRAQKSKSGRSKRGKGGQRRRKGGGRGQRRSQKKAPRQTELRIRHVGTVKWFDEARGYGFIAQDDGEELFVHTSGVLGPSSSALEQGQQVEYEIEHTKRGLQAVDVIQLP